MKVYKCDICEKMIENPYKTKMKEFYVGIDFDITGLFPKKYKQTRKIHICDTCKESLYIVAKKQSLMLVKTKDILVRDNKKYEVVIADDNIFVVCPIVYDEKEKSDVVKYDKAEIYANQDYINTLKELRFENWKNTD